MNDGTFAQDEFERRMTRPGRYVWRMRDKKDLMGLNRGKKVKTFPVPSDYLVGEEGRVCFAEVKSISEKERFDYSMIQPGQRSAATISASIGAPYFFYVYSIAQDAWFVLTAAEFASDIKAGKKSRRFEELTPFAFS